MTASGNPFSFAIDGKGLFAVMDDENVYYTRNGNFQMAMTSDEGFMLCTSEGYPVLDIDGMPIQFDKSYESSKIVIAGDGTVCYPDKDGNLQSLDIKIGLYQFSNPSGLESVGSTMYKETDASGVAMEETASPELKASKIRQGYLESSNVQVADEMVNLIVAQRAYEMNSKAIQASDEMLGQANQLRR